MASARTPGHACDHRERRRVCPMKSGVIIERRDHVLMTFLVPFSSARRLSSASASTKQGLLDAESSSRYSPYLRFLPDGRRRTIILFRSLLLRTSTNFALARGETGGTAGTTAVRGHRVPRITTGDRTLADPTGATGAAELHVGVVFAADLTNGGAAAGRRRLRISRTGIRSWA